MYITIYDDAARMLLLLLLMIVMMMLVLMTDGDGTGPNTLFLCEKNL